ncbi:MAG: nickel-dependent lactate racemase [Athalassotoga sp.]
MVKIPYGISYLNVERNIETLNVRGDIQSNLNEAEIDHIINTCFGSLNYDEDKPIGIAVPDLTRPGTWVKPFKSIVKNLKGKKIKVFIGSGLHEPPTFQEIKNFLFKEKIEIDFDLVIHDANDKNELAYVGKTKRGTPVWINKSYLKCGYKIAIGVVEPHQFAGFSGGSKAVAIGLGGEETISFNHSMMTDPFAVAGLIDGNPVREDIEEMGQMVGIDKLVNVVMDSNGKIFNIFCGSNPESHRKAAELITDISGYKVSRLYDVVITSPGGSPRDRDLYQAQKALIPAEFFCKEGGEIILVAECAEGFADEGYLEILERASSPKEVIDKFDFKHFKVGPHKAFLLAKTLSKFKVKIFSKLDPWEMKKIFFDPIDDIERSLENYKDEDILLMPNAIQVLPVKNTYNRK